MINRVNAAASAAGRKSDGADFSIAADTARFGLMAGPRHSADPTAALTDFLHLYVGFAHAMSYVVRAASCSKALRLGLLNQVVPVLTRDGRFIPNPLVVTDVHRVDQTDRSPMVPVPPEQAAAAKALMAACRTDFTRLDEAVARWSAKPPNTMPDCLQKNLRKKKLEHAGSATARPNRSRLALNRMTEAKAAFRAFNEGSGGRREVDFAELRRRLARGEPWTDELVAAVQPSAAHVERGNPPWAEFPGSRLDACG